MGRGRAAGLTAAQARRRAEILAAVLILAALPLFARRVRGAFAAFPWDFAIDWTAAHALRRGVSLYDADALRTLGAALAGPRLEGAFTGAFNGYVGPPSTAVLFVPLTALPFETGAWAWRAAILVGFALAVAVAARSLPPEDRRLGALLGALFLVTSSAVTFSLRLGQVDACIALALAAACLALARGREGAAGAFVGAAALLKVSPGAALVHALFRRRPRVAFAGAVAGLAGLGLASLAVRTGDTETFLRRVAPSISKGSFGMENQSLPGWIARLLLPRADLTNFLADAGPVAALSPLLLAGLLAILWFRSRGRAFTPFELCLAVLAGLLAGPVTWTVYTSWTAVFAVRLADGALWSSVPRRRRLLAVSLLGLGWILLALPLYLLPESLQPARYFQADVVAAHPTLRLASGAHALALLCWFGAGLFLGPIRRADG